jgi:predicted XRE-type DNA-binding protein
MAPLVRSRGLQELRRQILGRRRQAVHRRREDPTARDSGQAAGRGESVMAELGPDNIYAQMGERDAEERQLRATLVSRLRAVLADRKLSQAEASKVLGLSHPFVTELTIGAASGFSAERLIVLLNKAGVSVSLAFREEPDWRPGETNIDFGRDR